MNPIKELTPQDRKELADSLRAIRRQCDDKAYARAFCRCVLVNARTGLMVVPRQDGTGNWWPKRMKEVIP